jgi:tRNA A-37 threonylcarbamoyl transferase component Bud32
LFDYGPIHIAGYHGWILRQYNIASFRECLEELFVSNFSSQSPHILDVRSSSPEREVYRLKISTTEEIYVKRYHAVSWKQIIQTFLHVHKAQKSWRIARILLRKGIPTPLPIAYLIHRTRISLLKAGTKIPPLRGAGCSARLSVVHILVTQGINGISLSECIHEKLSLTDKRKLIQSVAEFLGKLHAEGVYHGDLTARNILVEDGQGDQFRIYLIDLDSVRSTWWISNRRAMKNLDELGRNFLDLRVFSTTDRGRFLQHYLRANPKEPRTVKQLFKYVLQRTQKRLQKHGKQFTPSLKHNPFGSHAHWNLDVFPRWKDTFRNIDEVVTVLTNPEKIIQENIRGIVFLIRHNGTLFIAKRSKIQENRRWVQFTSLYRKGEGARTLQNMARLYALGLPVPEPVLVLEQKKYGFVVASWSLYRYLEGYPCSCAQSHLVAETLRDIHQKGWVHRDPHVKNFLFNGEHICIIDCARARPWRSRYAQIYDVVLLDKCCPGSRKYYGISESDWLYRIAKFHNRVIILWRKIKRRIRHHIH